MEGDHQQCGLCQEKLSSHPIVDGIFVFCCHGCQAVFAILSARKDVSDYQAHPLFLQALRSGLISNPALLEQIRNKSSSIASDEWQKLYFEVEEMWCSSCAELIKLVLLQNKGIKSCTVDYATDLGVLEFAPRLIGKEEIFEMIRALGYHPKRMDDAKKGAVSKTLYLRFIIAAFSALNAMMFAYPLYASYFDDDPQGYGQLFAWLSFAASLPVLTYSAWPIFRRLMSSLSVGLFGMEALVSIGVLSAFGLSCFELFQGGIRVYFDSMAVIITFVLLGKIVENKAKFSAKESLLRLNRSVPKRGRKRLQDGSFAYVLVKDLSIGDFVQVRLGETIVLDGIVHEGEGSCNESLMTGEAVPILKSKGDKVIGGSILQQGNLLVQVSVGSEESVLQRIIDIVEGDIGRKSTYIRLADSVTSFFVPFVLLTALIVAAVCFLSGIQDGENSPSETAVLRAIAILLISCPCAIGIAVPVVESRLIDKMSKLGAIVRNRGSLRLLGKETAIVFDKTGTITKGHFHVISGMESLLSDEKMILKILVEKSNHPIACAISSALDYESCQEENLLREVRVEEIIGKGLKGYFKGRYYYLGSLSFLLMQGISFPDIADSSSDSLVTTVYFANDSGGIAALQLGDKLRPGAVSIVPSLLPAKGILLSGDSKPCVSAVAKQCGFSEYVAEASPLVKHQYIDALKKNGEIVCMVGDGINDSPALTHAHLGISVVSASDISIQVSDILLTTDRLEVIQEIRELGKKGNRLIRQNLFWAFFYNVVGIGLAACGLLSPIFAAFAMVVSSLIVLCNAQRLQ